MPGLPEMILDIGIGADMLLPCGREDDFHGISPVSVDNGLVNNGAPDEGKAEKFKPEGGG